MLTRQLAEELGKTSDLLGRRQVGMIAMLMTVVGGLAGLASFLLFFVVLYQNCAAVTRLRASVS